MTRRYVNLQSCQRVSECELHLKMQLIGCACAGAGYTLQVLYTDYKMKINCCRFVAIASKSRDKISQQQQQQKQRFNQISHGTNNNYNNKREICFTNAEGDGAKLYGTIYGNAGGGLDNGGKVTSYLL